MNTNDGSRWDSCNSSLQHRGQILPQHCLYFLPLPQGQGSLRPTFGPARTGLALVTASAASLTMSLPWAAAVVVPPELALADPPKAAVEACSVRLGMLRRKFSKAMRLEALRKMLWQISVLMLIIKSSKSVKASALYSINGSRCP